MVEEILFPKILALFLLLLLPLLSKADDIVQLNDLTSLRVSYNTARNLPLQYYIQGQNLTYSLSGSYSGGLNAANPSLTQGINLISTTKKAAANNPPNSFDLIQQDQNNPQLLYTVEGSNLNFWNIASLSNIQLLGSSPISGTGTVVGVYSVYLSNSAYYIILQSSKTGISASLYNLTKTATISPIAGMTYSITTTYSLIGSSFTTLNSNIFSFVQIGGTTPTVYVISFDTLHSTAILYNQINNSTVQARTFNPISIGFSSNNYAYICDTNNGVFIFNATSYLSSQNQILDIPMLLQDPSDYGYIFSCSLDNNWLAVGTSQGVALYLFPSLQFVKKLSRYARPHEATSLLGLQRLSNTYTYTTSYFISNLTTSFRVQYLQAQLQENLLISEVSYDLFSTDASVLAPPYIVLAMNNIWYAIFNTPSYIWVYQINRAYATSVALSSPYTFKGELVVSNLNVEIEVPVVLEGVDPKSYEIYGYKGWAQSAGFSYPSEITMYMNTNVTKQNLEFYLPVSNYYAGQGLAYKLDALTSSSDLTIGVSLPPKYLQTSNINTQSSITFSPILATDFNELIPIAIAIPTGDSSITIYSLDSTSGPQRQTTFACQNSSMYSTNAVTFIGGNIRFLIVECALQNQNTGAYDVDWYIYSVSSSYQQSLLGNFSWTQILPSTKLSIICTNIAALRGQQIEIYQFDQTTYKLTEWTPINTNSVSGINQFMPIDFVIENNGGSCSNIYVYDFNAGLIQVAVSNSAGPYVVSTIGTISTLQDIYARIGSYGDYVFIISPQSDSEMSFASIQISSSTYQITYYPVFSGCSYTAIDISDTFVVVLCENISGNQLLVFDYNDYTFENLYTSIPVDSIGAISLEGGSINSLFVYTGNYFSSYALSQIGIDFSPPTNSDFIPNYYSGVTTWAYIYFNFTTPPSADFVVEFELNATNAENSNKTTITFNLIPRGTAILQGTNYATSSSLLTSGEKVKISDTSFIEPIPLNAFIGNNLNFGLINNKNGTLIENSQLCPVETSPICVLGKYKVDGALAYEQTSVSAFDITHYGNLLYVSIENAIIAYDTTTSPYSVSQVYNLTDFRGSYTTNCLKIKHTPYANVLIMSCTEWKTETSMYSDTYLTVLNLTIIKTAQPVMLKSYPAVLITIVDDVTQQYPLAYVHDFQTVDVYQIVTNNGAVSLNLVSYIDPEVIDTNSFFICSVLYINSTDLILLEIYSGFIYLKATQTINPVGFTYMIFATFPVPSSIVNYENTYYTSAYMASDKKTILATEVRGDVYIYDINNEGLELKGQYPPLAQEYAYWINSLTANETDKLMMYPIWDTNKVKLRVLNYTENPINAIYTDIDLGIPLTSLSFGSIANINIDYKDANTIRVIAFTQLTQKTSNQVILAEINLLPQVIISPIDSSETVDYSLTAYIEESDAEAQLGTLSLIFGKGSSPSDGGSSSGNNKDWYKEWWVWFIIIVGVLLVLATLGIAVFFLKRSRKKREMQSLLMVDKKFSLNTN